MRIFVVLSCIFVFGVAPVFAQGTAGSAQSDVKSSAEEGELLKAQQKALVGKVAKIIKSLDKSQMEHFLAMYTNYNIYSLVSAVQDDVRGAVEKCAENNKDMASKVNNKFEKWEKNVGASMKEARANIKNMSLAQTYVSQANLDIVFGLVDETRAVNSSRFESAPVSTPEACEFMMSKMDETEDNMTGLLSVSFQSYPKLLRQNQK